MFLFFVMMVEDCDSAEDYAVKMTISSQDSTRRISHECPVHYISDIPSMVEFKNETCYEFWCVPYESMRCLFRTTKTWHNKKWQLGFTTEVEIKKNNRK